MAATQSSISEVANIAITRYNLVEENLWPGELGVGGKIPFAPTPAAWQAAANALGLLDDAESSRLVRYNGPEADETRQLLQLHSTLENRPAADVFKVLCEICMMWMIKRIMKQQSANGHHLA